MNKNAYTLLSIHLLLLSALSIRTNTRDEFLQQAFCPTGTIEQDLPTNSPARNDYEAIKKLSTSWCASTGLCTPNQQNALQATEKFIKTHSYEQALAHTTSEQLATIISLAIQARLHTQLMLYSNKTSVPYGLLRNFLGNGLQKQIREEIQTIKQKIKEIDNKPCLVLFESPDKQWKCTMSTGLLKHLFNS